MNEKEFLGKRRDRALATILSFKEKNCDAHLPSDVSKNLREVVLDQINDLVDLAFDIIGDDNFIDFNEEFLDRLEAIYYSDK